MYIIIKILVIVRTLVQIKTSQTPKLNLFFGIDHSLPIELPTLLQVSRQASQYGRTSYSLPKLSKNLKYITDSIEFVIPRFQMKQ